MMKFGPGSWFEALGGWKTAGGKLFLSVCLALALPVLLTTHLNMEEQMVREEFGSEWDAWAQRTPYRLIPFVY